MTGNGPIETIGVFLGNVTEWGLKARSWYFSDFFKSEFLIGIALETHKKKHEFPDMRDHARTEGYKLYQNHARQSLASAKGSHGGEAILVRHNVAYCRDILIKFGVHFRHVLIQVYLNF